MISNNEKCLMTIWYSLHQINSFVQEFGHWNRKLFGEVIFSYLSVELFQNYFGVFVDTNFDEICRSGPIHPSNRFEKISAFPSIFISTKYVYLVSPKKFGRVGESAPNESNKYFVRKAAKGDFERFSFPPSLGSNRTNSKFLFVS